MYVSPIPHPSEGRIAIVTDVGLRDAMDALAAPDERDLKRTAKTCGPGTPTLVSSLLVMIRQATEAIKPGTPGRART